MLVLQDLTRALSNYNTGSLGIAYCDAWHDGAISDAKSLDAIHLQRTIDDGHRIPTHLGGTGLMPLGDVRIPDKILAFSTVEIARHYLAFYKGFQRR